MKYLIIAIALFLAACSTGESRKEQASKLGTVIWQEEPNTFYPALDIFLVKDKDKFRIVKISGSGDIYDIEPLPDLCKEMQ